MTSATILDHLIDNLRRAAIYNRHDLAAPSVVLWTDGGRLWTKIISLLPDAMPELLILAPEIVDERTGRPPGCATGSPGGAGSSRPGNEGDKTPPPQWVAFKALCKPTFGLNPDKDGVIAAVERLVAGGGIWDQVWIRYCQAHKAFAGVRKALELARPKDMLDELNERMPGVNRKQEDALRSGPAGLAGMAKTAALKALKGLCEQHTPRAASLWANFGEAPLARAAVHLQTLAEGVSTGNLGNDWDSLAAGYVERGWLLLPGDLPKVELAGHLNLSRWPRCAVPQPGAHHGFKELPWFWGGGHSVVFAPGISAFKAGVEYTHGGLSPQEALTPILTVSTGEQSVQPVAIVSAEWKGLRLRVQLQGGFAGTALDLRTKPADADSSVLDPDRRGLPPGLDGSAALLVTDDKYEGSVRCSW